MAIQSQLRTDRITVGQEWPTGVATVAEKNL